MKYYQITDELARTHGEIFVPGELFTEREMNINKYCKDNEKFFVKREIKKNNVYWSFGARFECGVSRNE